MKVNPERTEMKNMWMHFIVWTTLSSVSICAHVVIRRQFIYIWMALVGTVSIDPHCCGPLAHYWHKSCLTFALVANWLNTTLSPTAQRVLLSLCHLGRIGETDGHTLRGTYSIERIPISVNARRVLFALSWDGYTVSQSSSTLMVCCPATDLCLDNIIFKLIICLVHPLLP